MVAVAPSATLTGTVRLRQSEVGVYRVALVEQRRNARQSALTMPSPVREPIDPLRDLVWARSFTVTTTYR